MTIKWWNEWVERCGFNNEINCLQNKNRKNIPKTIMLSNCRKIEKIKIKNKNHRKKEQVMDWKINKKIKKEPKLNNRLKK